MIQIQTTAVSGDASGNTCTVPKPTGLQVGDLMVAAIVFENSGKDLTPPSGWQFHRKTALGSGNIQSFSKIATAADVAATNFTWQVTDLSTDASVGAIVRITGASGISFDRDGVSSSGGVAWAAGALTPGTLYLLLGGTDCDEVWITSPGGANQMIVQQGNPLPDGASVMMQTSTDPTQFSNVIRNSNVDDMFVQGFIINPVYTSPTIKSHSFVNYTSSANGFINIPKPSGLAIGDLMIAQITGASNQPNDLHAPPTGWIRRRETTTGGESMVLFSKIADTNDVNASSFAFQAGDNEWIAGAILAITGVQNDFSQLTSQYYNLGGVTATFNDADLTPQGGSLLLFFTFLQNTISDASNEGIVNDNPVWNDVYGFGSTQPATDMSMGVDYAVRPQGTPTGDFFCTKPSSSSIIGIFLALPPLTPSPSPSMSPSISASLSPSASVSPSPSLSPSASVSASLSPSASRSVSVSTSPSASGSPSVSPSPSPGIDIYNTSIITAVKRVQQNMAFPQFVMGGKGGAGGTQFAMFKKDAERYGFSIFRFPVQRYDSEFDVFEISFPIIPGLQANMNILPVLYFDNESRVVAGKQININSYKAGTDYIILTAKNFTNSVRGKSNFFLELRWLGTKLATVGLPAKFIAEVQDD